MTARRMSGTAEAIADAAAREAIDRIDTETLDEGLSRPDAAQAHRAAAAMLADRARQLEDEEAGDA